MNESVSEWILWYLALPSLTQFTVSTLSFRYVGIVSLSSTFHLYQSLTFHGSFSLFHDIDIPKLKRENIKIASCHIDFKKKTDYSDGNYYFVGVFGVVHTLEAKSMIMFDGIRCITRFMSSCLFTILRFHVYRCGWPCRVYCRAFPCRTLGYLNQNDQSLRCRCPKIITRSSIKTKTCQNVCFIWIWCTICWYIRCLSKSVGIFTCCGALLVWMSRCSIC